MIVTPAALAHAEDLADFVAASGKPFPLDPGDIRLTLIGPQDAVEYRGCKLVD